MRLVMLQAYICYGLPQICHPVSVSIMTTSQVWSSVLQLQLVPDWRNVRQLVLVLLGHIIPPSIPA